MQPVAIVGAQPEHLVPHAPSCCIRALTVGSLTLSVEERPRLVADAGDVRKKRYGLAEPALPHGADKRDTISRRTTRETAPPAVLAPGECRRIRAAVNHAARAPRAQI